jgi:hypothetical protein
MIEHLIEDFEARRSEDDLTHHPLPRFSSCTILPWDPGIEDEVSFRKRTAGNAEVRSLHHHVFDTRLAVASVRHAGFEPTTAELLQPCHIVVVARKFGADAKSGLSSEALERILEHSPFQTDR